MKICNKCKCEKDISEFSKNKARPDGLNNWCKVCMRKNSRKYYKTNKERMVAQIAENKAARVAENLTKLKLYLANNPCSVCGEGRLPTLDFHHRNPEDKDGNVTKILNSGYSWEVVLAEIEKCDVLCANCHRILHSEGTWRYMGS